MPRWILYIVTAALAGLVAVTVPHSKTSEPAECKVPVDKRLVKATTDFGFRLLKQLAEENKGKNIFISPASVSIALCMTYNGASGETQQAMAHVLGLNSLTLTELNEASKNLLDNLKAPGKGVTLEIANSLWARKDITFKSEFMDRNRRYFESLVSTLDFGNPDAVKTINKWVSDQTHGRIDEIVKRIEADTILFLINAVYFKGSWESKFDPRDTHLAEFTLSDGFKKMVRMMFRHGRIQYLPGDGFAAVNLPYGNGRISMYIFLPNKDRKLTDFVKSLNSDAWEKWMQSFHSVECDLSLPRFKIEFESELRRALSALGMGIAFNPDKADFRNMCPIPPLPNVYMKSVLHKTFVEVNEEGTEAAATTKVEVGLTSAAPSVVFTVDRPFFCAIRDNFTGEVLFAGTVFEPT